MNQEEHLIHMWINKKYWEASCEDEAIDWNNLSNSSNISLPVEYISEYIAWREDYLKTINRLSNITSYNQILHYACRPWELTKENKQLVLNNINNN